MYCSGLVVFCGEFTISFSVEICRHYAISIIFLCALDSAEVQMSNCGIKVFLVLIIVFISSRLPQLSHL